ncbi:2-phospho-L-lactate guanylyltransferase [Streptomyces sp. NPDC014735]|uniref:2-phospho-L-lactate guanylyltransferase n=1 Tax=unclassified Streptomyces TaxID=2593676 RepID=UPI00093C360E|nr:2-phospho-L-lactate guanylyltransferase [Streptomyces sp. CB01580]OKJ37674.1 2-phospho-L-lactate guanylyltransferase [Streptomyces sp. CB01580]
MATNTDPAGPTGSWTLVVPLKPLALAKSRLTPTTGDALRPRLALAFARDTVAAALSCPAVRDVVVVTDDPGAGAALATLGANVVPDEPGRGLNAALAHGARTVRSRRPGAPLAALGADLPALRPAELSRVLEFAAAFPRAFVTDAAGIGTTFLSAAPGAELHPLFGGPSRARHLDSGAVEVGLTGIDSVRQDVDTGEDLRAALGLGVGPHTAGCRATGAAPADR